MTALERYESFIYYLLAAAASAITAVATWLVRRILTNQKQIEALKTEIAVRNAQREAERETLLEMKDDIRQLRKDVQEIFRRDHQ